MQKKWFTIFNDVLFLSSLQGKKEMAIGLNLDPQDIEHSFKFMAGCMLIVHNLFILVALGKC